ncbi:MAG TPA: formate dehydrogenase-N subunit alpha, partial [bacterium]|nr:formate dehydrogenase-N subunit alpha [bacterium]
YTKTGAPGKAGTIMYAMGWTQHTVGVQNIRTMGIIQLLLGNIGVAGGGVNALRGESNVQGSTDQGLLYNVIPGYLKTPVASAQTLADYTKKFTPVTSDPKSLNWWSNTPKYMVSFLKAFYGDKAVKENDFGYAMLPKLDDGVNYSWLVLFDEMAKGKFKGFFAWGQNPACSSANANKVRQAMGNLDWMVNVNLFDNETGSFWRGPGMDPSKIKTEVFMLPCAASVEKEGSLANSGRWVQWRYKAIDPPGIALPDGEIIFELFEKIRALYEKEGGKYPDPILSTVWNYKDQTGKFNVVEIAKEMNGKYAADVTKPDGTSFKKGTQVVNFTVLTDDGTTACGNWIYSGSFTEAGNMTTRRNNEDKSGIGLYSEWSWSWPLNRRIIYNRASVDKNGEPRDKEHPVIKWDAASSKWIGDIADNAAPPLSDPKGKLPFIMQAEGYGRLFGGFTLNDGPFPEHYEPLECPVDMNPFSSQLNTPTLRIFGEKGDGNGEGKDVFLSNDGRYPYVCSTYRMPEHWQTGLMTRYNPQLIELQPQNICEISKELAKEKGIKNGDKVIMKSARGQIEAVAVVTSRYKPFVIHGKKIHQVGTTWHFGWMTPSDGGDSANLLTPTAGDPNTFIPESKAFMVNIERKG